MYSNLVELIEKSPFVKFSKRNKTSNIEEWIKKAEDKLELALPPSYKWWLTNYGGGEITGDEIFSLYEEDFEEAVGGDLVYNFIINEKNKLFCNTQLFICDGGNDEAWFFDTKRKSETGEYQIYRYDYYDDSATFYADTFADFLLKRIKENTTPSYS